MTKYLVLTGCTGLLGRYLLRGLLAADIAVAVVVRPEKRRSAEGRVEALIAEWEDDLGRPLPRPACLAGDLNRPGLGISPEDRAWMAQSCDRFLHNAASLIFEGKDRAAEPWLSNLEGTRRALELCEDLGIAEFHYVSTAYVCGRREGTIRESELDLGQDFRNDYERSKREAESLVRRSGWLGSATVYRPAVIVGDSRTGRTSTYHGLYRYLQFAAMLHQQAEKEADELWRRPIRLEIDGQARLNLVPVDWVAEVIAGAVGDPRLHGATYHLTPDRTTRPTEISEALARYFDYHGVEFVGRGGIAPGTACPREEFFLEYSKAYGQYLRDEPSFDRANTRAAFPGLPCPPVDVACLLRLIDFGVRDRWGKGQAGRVLSSQGSGAGL